MSNTIMTGYIQSALQTLLFTNDQLEKTQERSTSGLKVASAADNAGYWSAATSMTSDGSVLGSIGDALNLGASKVDTTYESVTSAIKILDEMTALVTTAYEQGTDRATLNNSLSAFKSNLASIVHAANFSGDNWLYNTDTSLPAAKSVPSSFQRSISGSVSLQYITINTSETTLIDTQDANRGLLTGAIDANALDPDSTSTVARNYYLLDGGSSTPAGGTEIAVSDATTNEELDDMISVLGSITDSLNTLASKLGTMSNRIEQQSGYVESLQAALDESVSRLVETDMEEESTRLAAYRAQRDLAVEIVGMANDHRRSLAALFG